MDDIASRNERLCENASVITKAAEKLKSGYAGLKDLEIEGVNLAREREELIAEFTALEAEFTSLKAATDGLERAQISAALDTLAFSKLEDRWIRTQERRVVLELVRGAVAMIESLTDRVHEPRKTRLKASLTLLHELMERADQVVEQSRFDQTRIAVRRLDADPGDYAKDNFVGNISGLIKGCYSAQAHEYQKEIGLREDGDNFLALLHMLANDSRKTLEIENPPARVRAAIRREESRSQRQLWKRSQQFAPEVEANLPDSCLLESSVIAGVDWARGIQTVDLSEDQKLAVAAKSDGLDLQSSEAPEYLGMDSVRVSSIRRSLGSDRRASKRLRKYFKVYKTAKSPAQGSTSDLREDQSTIK